jgi:hypothetical protein
MLQRSYPQKEEIPAIVQYLCKCASFSQNTAMLFGRHQPKYYSVNFSTTFVIASKSLLKIIATVNMPMIPFCKLSSHGTFVRKINPKFTEIYCGEWLVVPPNANSLIDPFACYLTN